MGPDKAAVMAAVETAMKCTLTSFSIVDSTLSLQLKLTDEKTQSPPAFFNAMKKGVPKDITFKGKITEKNVLKNCDGCEKDFQRKAEEICIAIEVSDVQSKCAGCVKNAGKRDLPKKETEFKAVSPARRSARIRIKKSEVDVGDSDERPDHHDATVDEQEEFPAANNDDDYAAASDDDEYKPEDEGSDNADENIDSRSRHGLKSHRKTHNEKHFQCHICRKVFNGYFSFVRHKKVHDHTCQVCGKKYNRPILLKTHMLRHHNASEGRFSCQYCGKIFTAVAYLRKHLKTQQHANHDQENTNKPNICPVCGKKHAKRTDLARHMENHTVKERKTCAKMFTGRLYKCPVCGENHVTRAYLRKHMEDHTDEERKACGKSNRFKQNKRDGAPHESQSIESEDDDTSTAQQHDNNKEETAITQSQSPIVISTRSNRERIQNKCPVCEEIHSTRTNLTKHMENHTVEERKTCAKSFQGRLYKCPVCGENHVTRAYLRKHMEDHTDEERKACATGSPVKQNNQDVTDENLSYQNEEDDTSTAQQHANNNQETATIQSASVISTFKQSSDEGKHNKCIVCGETHHTRFQLQKHMENHTVEERKACAKTFLGRLYKCPVCDENHVTRAYLKKHMEDHKDKTEKKQSQSVVSRSRGSSEQRKMYTCPICGETNTRPNLKKHMDKHTDEERKACAKTFKGRLYKCPVCGENHVTRAYLWEHMEVHTEEDRKAFAEKCKRRKKIPGAVTLKVESDGSEIADDNDDDAQDENTSERKQKSQAKKKKQEELAKLMELDPYAEHTCTFCNSVFPCRRYFVNHCKLVHSVLIADSSFLCHICGKAFTSQENVNKHVQSKCVFSENEKQKCEICGITTVNSVTLEKHMRHHTADKSYMCELCGKCFLKKGNLTSHMHTHANLRPHKCDICEMSFRNVWHMKMHRKTHTGENLFQCPQCKDWFINESYLKNQHQRRYCKALKVCSCEVCGREFPNRISLESHMGYHSGERPYMCDKCGKAFSKIANRDVHYKHHFDEATTPCPYCDRLFKLPSEMRKHMKRHFSPNSTHLKRNNLPEELKPKNIPQDVIITEQELDQATVIIEDKTHNAVNKQVIDEGLKVDWTEFERQQLDLEPVGDEITVATTTIPLMSSGHVTVTLPSSHVTTSGNEITYVLPSITDAGEVLLVAMEPDIKQEEL